MLFRSDRDGVVLIEWGERFPQLMPVDRVVIRLEATGEDERKVVVTGLE